MKPLLKWKQTSFLRLLTLIFLLLHWIATTLGILNACMQTYASYTWWKSAAAFSHGQSKLCPHLYVLYATPIYHGIMVLRVLRARDQYPPSFSPTLSQDTALEWWSRTVLLFYPPSKLSPLLFVPRERFYYPAKHCSWLRLLSWKTQREDLSAHVCCCRWSWQHLQKTDALVVPSFPVNQSVMVLYRMFYFFLSWLWIKGIRGRYMKDATLHTLQTTIQEGTHNGSEEHHLLWWEVLCVSCSCFFWHWQSIQILALVPTWTRDKTHFGVVHL